MTMIRNAGFMPAFRPTAQAAAETGAPKMQSPATRADEVVFGSAPAATASAPRRSTSGVRRLATGIALGVACTLAPAIMLHGGVARAAVSAQPAPTVVTQSVGTSLGQPAAVAPSLASLGQPVARPIVPVTLQSPTYPSPVGASSPKASAVQSAAPHKKAATPSAAAKSKAPAVSEKASGAKPADDTILTHLGKDTHVVADKTADVGKAVWHPLKKAGLGIGHFFAKGGHQLKEGWDSKDQ